MKIIIFYIAVDFSHSSPGEREKQYRQRITLLRYAACLFFKACGILYNVENKGKPKKAHYMLQEQPNIFEGFCPIEPKPKGRPRFARRGKFVQTYTPKETEVYESEVRTWMIKHYGLTTQPMDGAIKATYEFVLPRPTTARKSDIFSYKKPDIDNLVKSFQDAFDFKRKSGDIQLGVIANDSRISVLHVSKRYASAGEKPGTKFKLEKVCQTLVIVDGNTEELSTIFSKDCVVMPFNELRTCPKDKTVRKIIIFCHNVEKSRKIVEFCKTKFSNVEKYSII